MCTVPAPPAFGWATRTLGFPTPLCVLPSCSLCFVNEEPPSETPPQVGRGYEERDDRGSLGRSWAGQRPLGEVRAPSCHGRDLKRSWLRAACRPQTQPQPRARRPWLCPPRARQEGQVGSASLDAAPGRNRWSVQPGRTPAQHGPLRDVRDGSGALCCPLCLTWALGRGPCSPRGRRLLGGSR